MKTTIGLLVSVFALTFVVAGCGDDTTSSSGGDMAVAAAHDLATGGTTHDLATSNDDAGLKPLAATCATGAECASGTCAPYAGGTKMLCSYTCTANQAAPQCTSPGDGTCNGMGYCKFPGM